MFVNRNRRPRPGKVLVLVAVCLVGILGVVAIALEGGLMLDKRRHVQAIADAAAMAGAENLFLNYEDNRGTDPGGTAYDAAIATAAQNGYSDSDGSVVEVFIPPVSGNFVGKRGYIEVVIHASQGRYFSRIWGEAAMPIVARAVARGSWDPNRTGILVLDLHEAESLKTNGTGTVNVANADLIVNSDDESAVGSDGAGSLIKVTNATASITGGLKSNTTIIGPTVFGEEPTPDPLAYLPAPPKPSVASSITKYNSNNATAKAYCTALGLDYRNYNQVHVLEPGRYDSMPNFTNTDLVILQQASTNTRKGVFYLNGCGFTSTGATIMMDPNSSGGVLFYNDPQKTSDGLNITGGKVVLRPPTVPPYKGILFWQRRDSDIPFQITGQGSMNIYGTFYVAGGPIKVTGSDATGLDVIGSQYISRTLQSGGNGEYKVDWNPDYVAPLRKLALLE